MVFSNAQKITYATKLQYLPIYCVKNTRLSPARTPFFALYIEKSFC